MQPRSPTAKLFVALCICLAAAVQLPARAQEPDSSINASFAVPTRESIAINVLVGQSKVITFDRPIGRFSISSPEIAEGVLVSPQQVLVNGKAFGQVNFIAWEQTSQRFIVFDVYVRTNLSLIDTQMRVLFPKDDIRLSQANGSVVLSGSVTNAKTSERAEAVVQAAGFKTVNMLEMPVADMTQVQLQVRVAEVSRNRLRELGASYAYQSSPGTGGFANSGAGPGALSEVTGGVLSGTIANTLNLFIMGGNTMSMIRALQTQGALRALAEPNLIAMNGQQASFLAGGEFPVPIVQNGAGDRTTVTVVFKEYGVRLNFKPTIIDEDHIRLELEPEVSTIDFANGVRFSGFIIPALRTRRAKTGVELRDGQSFALAGLLDNNETQSLSKVPGLGDIPILGALFRSKQFQKQESELMFIVTAQLVKPVNRDDLPQLHGTDGLKRGSLLGIEPQGGVKGEGVNGPSGFSIKRGVSATEQPQAPPVKTAAPANAAPAVAAPGATTPAAVVLPATDMIGFSIPPAKKTSGESPPPAQVSKAKSDN